MSLSVNRDTPFIHGGGEFREGVLNFFTKSGKVFFRISQSSRKWVMIDMKLEVRVLHNFGS
jgi:hypothetical protein